MNKKIVIIVLISVFILWTIYVVVDCIRINNFKDKPLLVISEKNYEDVNNIETSAGNVETGKTGTIYIGIGYTKEIYKNWNLDRQIGKDGYIIKLLGVIPVSGFENH